MFACSKGALYRTNKSYWRFHWWVSPHEMSEEKVQHQKMNFLCSNMIDNESTRQESAFSSPNFFLLGDLYFSTLKNKFGISNYIYISFDFFILIGQNWT